MACLNWEVGVVWLTAAAANRPVLMTADKSLKQPSGLEIPLNPVQQAQCCGAAMLSPGSTVVGALPCSL